ncbi:MAG: winged helix-turn-helix domain-containing protein [Gemmatimonadetes bacterium]|nr:winged helix-turn-helix domain-containing protein [Gemmatimonadota bacterium]
MASLELRLLGRFEARLKGGPAIDLPTKKTKLLLAYLALTPGEAHSRDKLCALLWSDRGDEQAHHSLRNALLALRKELGDAEPPPFVAERETIGLDTDAVEVDAVTFENLVAAGTREALEQASALYRGDLLEGISVRDPPFEEWLFYERQRLRDLALRAFEQLLVYQQEAGELEKAVETAQRLLKLEPAHEKTHRELMRFYADQGREAAALKQYQHCRAALERELGVKPGAETEQLYQDILQRHGGPPEKVASPAAMLKQAPRRWAAIGGGALLLVAAIVVAVWQLFPSPAPPPTELALGEAPALELPAKPSIAVLPFKNLSGDPEQEYFADGITEEIITELSRFRNLFVIAHHSVFTYKGKEVTVQQVARELGVQYVLEGSVRKEGERLRITAQLADATTGHHVWAESYDRDAKDIFAVQEEVTQKIVATVGSGEMGQVTRAGQERARRKATDNLEAYDYYLLGLWYKERWTKEDNATARRMVEKAIELDPEFARAYATLAWRHYWDWFFQWSESPAVSADRAFELAKRAVALDPSDAHPRWTLGAMYFWMRHQYEEGVFEYERALALNPNYADVLADWGLVLAFLGRAEEGIGVIENAMRLNPYYPDWYLWGLGTAFYNAQRYEEAIPALQKVQNHTADTRAYLAASYAQAGRAEEARAEVAEVLELDPEFSSAHWAEKQPYKNQADRDHYLDGLRKAGLPE